MFAPVLGVNRPGRRRRLRVRGVADQHTTPADDHHTKMGGEATAKARRREGRREGRKKRKKREGRGAGAGTGAGGSQDGRAASAVSTELTLGRDRKSTRLNSSHANISY